jgi:zinc protease
MPRAPRVSPVTAALTVLNDPTREIPPYGHITHDGDTAFGPLHTVSRFRLANGLTILTLVDSSAPVFSYQTWFAVGSRHEKQGKTGLAHLFEHLMFNETENLPAGTFDKRLEESGAESNAATWVDWTFYYENLPKDRLKLVTELESERMARLVLRDPQLISEKEVVTNERRQRVEDDVDGSVNELLYRLAFEKHGYGWPTIGWMDDIQGFTTEDCLAFYRTYYAPNNATVVVVGDVKIKDVLGHIQRAYGGMAPAVLPIEDVQPEPPQTAERTQEVEKPTATHKVCLGYRGPALGDADHAALSVLNEVLFGGRASRVHRALVQDKELALEVRGWVSTFRDPGLYDISMTGREGVTGEQLLEALDFVLDSVVQEPITAAELSRVKARLELSALQGMETASGKAEQIGFWEVLAQEPAGALTRVAVVARVTVSDVLRAARRYLTRSSRSVILVRPDPHGDSDAADDDDQPEDAAPAKTEAAE